MTDQELDVQALEVAKQYMGGFAPLTISMGLLATGGFFATPFLVDAGVISFWLGALLMALLTYVAYTALHEAVHGSISGSHRNARWVNELVGYACALVLAAPLTAHRHEHLAHHRHTNDPESDPDYGLSDLNRSPLAAVNAAAKGIFENYRYYISHRWANGNVSQDRAFCAEIAAIIGARLLVIALVDPATALALFAVGGLGGVVLLGYLFANLVHDPYQDVGRYVDTATILAPPRLNTAMTWLWLFQNYHSIHHLFPRVPFYHYRKIFDQIEHIMLQRGAPIYRLSLSGRQRSAPASRA